MRTSIPFRTVLRDDQAGPPTEVQRLVQGAAELLALGVRAELKPSAFNEGPIAVVALGQRPTLADSVEILAVEAGDAPGEVVVRYEVRSDGPQADAIAYPIHAVTVPRGTQTCRFERSGELAAR